MRGKTVTNEMTLQFEREAINKMWKAIIYQHEEEKFTDLVSDQIIIWTIGNPSSGTPGYIDALVDRAIKNRDRKEQLQFITAKVRMVADRFVNIDPVNEGNEIRRNNLDVMKFWMTELMEDSYFDNNIAVGMMKYKADRLAELYDSSPGKFNKFKASIYYYSEAIRKVRSKKAMAHLHLAASQLSVRFDMNDVSRALIYYNKGFRHAYRGLKLMAAVEQTHLETGGREVYRYEKPNEALYKDLKLAYGKNLLLYIYKLYLKKDYNTIVSLDRYVLNVKFDWEGRIDTLLMFGKACHEAGAASGKNDRAFMKFKKLCLYASSKAFKLALARNNGKPPEKIGDESFCKAFNAYYNYLDSYGQLIQAKQLLNQYQGYCP